MSLLSSYNLSKRKKLFLLWIVLIAPILTSSIAHATSAEKWQRISTPHYDIIFLSKMTREAQRLANTLETLYIPVSKTLYVSPKRIPIVLRNQTTVANGFITLIPPRRGEFFTFPPQAYNFLHNNDWLNLLAIHESRHIAQHELMLKSHLLSFAAPDWAWILEGDAVGIETALSKAGRGRIPYFEALYKVNLLEYGGFSYAKQMNRSYQHQIPDHYRIGYFLTTYLKRNYGADIINKLIQRDGFWESINPFALYNRCKKLIGKSLTQIYQDVNNELKGLWENQLKGLTITPFQPIHIRNSEDYIDYSYPQPTNQGMVVLQSGLGTITNFTYLSEDGVEEKIFTPGPIDVDIKFSVAKDKMVWIEHMPALRWEHKRYAAIQSYNITTKKYRTIAYPSRYSAAALSPDATKIVAVETDETYNHKILVLDAETGAIVYNLPNPANHYYLTPTWSSDGRYIVTVKHIENKATITLIDMQTGTSEDILPYTEELIGCPILHGAYIYYNSAYSGIDNIYAIHTKTKQRYQVTSSKYGAYHPALSTDRKWLLYNDFGKYGMNAVRTLLSPKQWTPIEKVEDRSIRYYEPLVSQENNADILTNIPSQNYQIENHSLWENASLDFTLYERDNPGSPRHNSGLVLQDILGAAKWMILGASDMIRVTGTRLTIDKLFTSFTYRGWYPIITVEGSLLGIVLEKEKDRKHTFNASKELKFNLEIPFLWNFGQYTHKISLSTASRLNTFNILDNKWMYFQDYTAFFSRDSKKSDRDIYSPWAQILSLTYTHSHYIACLTQACKATLELYFPGLYKHHSLRVGITQQYNLSFLSTGVDFPISIGRQATTINLNKPHSISINYAFPIKYIDKDLGSTLSIKRLRANLFYDLIYQAGYKMPSHIIGADLTIDIAAIRIGLRCTYNITDDKENYSLLL
jgi:hypothetical protein